MNNNFDITKIIKKEKVKNLLRDTYKTKNSNKRIKDYKLIASFYVTQYFENGNSLTVSWKWGKRKFDEYDFEKVSFLESLIEEIIKELTSCPDLPFTSTWFIFEKVHLYT